MEKRCTNCNRLLYIQYGEVKKIRTSDKIEYNIYGKIEIICKCGKVNN